MPPLWRDVSLFNPILYMVNAFRYGFLGVSDVPVTFAFGVLCVLSAVFFAISLWMFRRGKGLKN